MAIAYRSHTVQNTSGSGTITIAKPSGVVDGDLLVAFFSEDTDTPRITAPAGWSPMAGTGINADGSIVVGTSAVLQCFYKVASGEGASWGFTPSTSYTGVSGVVAYSGGDTSTPIDVAAGTSTASGTNHTSASITPSVANTMLVGIWMVDSNAANSWSSADMTERIDQSSGATQYVTLALYDLAYASTAAVSKTATFTATDRAAVLLLAIRPASTAITGTLDKSLGAATASSAGQLALTGTLDKSLGALTSSGAGQVALAGTLARTLGATTLSAAGGAPALAATLDKSLGALTASGAGQLALAATLDKPLGALTSSGAGQVAIAGTLARTLGAATVAAAGGTPALTGQLAATLGALTSSGAGKLAIAGALATTLGAATLSSTSGAEHVQRACPTGSAAATVAASARAARTIAASQVAAAAIAISGTAQGCS